MSTPRQCSNRTCRQFLPNDRTDHKCATCRKAYNTEYARRPKVSRKLKVCSVCQDELPIDSFYRDRKSKDGHQYQCKRCVRFRKMWQGRPDHDSTKQRIGLKLFGYLLQRDGIICPDCGCTMTNLYKDGDPLHDTAVEVDHIYPRGLGGTDALSNLRLCCRACNSRKGKAIHWDLLWETGLLSLHRQWEAEQYRHNIADIVYIG